MATRFAPREGRRDFTLDSREQARAPTVTTYGSLRAPPKRTQPKGSGGTAIYAVSEPLCQSEAIYALR